MALACEFSYHKPATLGEAVRLLGKHGPGARVLAGGTDLIGWLRDGRPGLPGQPAPDALVDIKGIAGLDRIESKNGAVRVGALVTFSALIESAAIKARLPLLWEAAGAVASCGIRNRATLAGNVCSAVSCCDAGPVLLAYEAVLSVRSKGGERKVPAAEWFVANRKTSIRRGELVAGVIIPVPARHGACYAKLGRTRGEDLAQASVAVLALPGGRFRVSFGSLAPKPLRAALIEEALSCKPLSEVAIDSAIRLVPREISPITDIRASKEYRLRMAQVMLARGIRTAVSRLSGKGPDYGARVI